MGVARKRMHAQATNQQKESCVTYVDTGTAILPKVLKGVAVM